MKREELMQSLLQESSEKILISEIVESDVDFLDRKIQSLENSIKDVKKDLIKRLRQAVEIDASVVEVSYGQVVKLEEQLDLYVNFKSTYYSEPTSKCAHYDGAR